MNDQPKILIVDDELGLREGCKRVLTAQGFSVEAAENGAEGLRKVQTEGYDLVLLDARLPDSNGVDLLQPIHQLDPEIVCVIITGYGTVDLAVKAIKQGAYDFINKPFTADDLLLVVNQGLERRRLSLEARRLQTIEAQAKRLAEEKALIEEIDRIKMAFLRQVTHELRAPVAAILSYLHLILNDDVPPERYKEMAGRAEAVARYQLELIGDLLELSKLKEFKLSAQVSLVDLGDILRQVAEQFGEQAREKKLQFAVHIATGLPPVRVVAEQFKSVWINLISNAIKYTLPGGTVEVSLRQEGEQLIGQVSDTGIGIPPEAQAKLFSEFFRASNAKSLTPHGTGLGLAIVKQIVEDAGGRIWVESAVGHGSTFTFTLPVANAPEEQNAE
ncbi:MAG: response regulator [Chloroflexi bacterium]|nr:response regulator [Chloroflexota bacterium]